MRTDFSTHDVLAETPYYTLYRQETWHALHPKSAVPGGAALVVDSLDRVLLLDVMRHPLGRIVQEIPRGFGEPGVDKSGLDTAYREAAEESGINFEGAKVLDLGVVAPDSGILALEIALAAIILPTPFDDSLAIDEEEARGYRVVPRSELTRLIAASDIQDAITISALFRYECALEHKADAPVKIDVLDAEGQVRITLTTDRPGWSFSQYCRNRETAGWHWRFHPKAHHAGRQS